MNASPACRLSRRSFLAKAAAAGVAGLVPAGSASVAAGVPPVEATFLFVADVHACRMAKGLSPNCRQEGKTDASLLRNIAALNGIGDKAWPSGIGGSPTGLRFAGQR